MNKTDIELSKEQKVIEKIENFFDKNKKILILAGAVLIVALLVLIIVSSSVNKSKEKAMIKVSELENSVYSLDTLDDSFKEKSSELINELSLLTKGNRYSSIKAEYLIGYIYFLCEDYENSYNYFISSYEKNKSIYLAPLSLINAAASAENSGNTDKAFELYSMVSDYEDTGLKAKALFNCGRIAYTKGNFDEANAYFNEIVEKYSFSEYAKLTINFLNK